MVKRIADQRNRQREEELFEKNRQVMIEQQMKAQKTNKDPIITDKQIEDHLKTRVVQIKTELPKNASSLTKEVA